MIRSSALPIAYYCGLAPVLAASDHSASSYAAQRAALKGTVYHRLSARDPSAVTLFDRLPREELEEVRGWALPTGLPDDVDCEIPVGLTPTGAPAPKGTPGNLTEGTADLAWIEGEAGEGVAVVVDLKTGARAIEDGPYSLQLVAYGFALAAKWGCQAMRLGIWFAREGEWAWSETIQLDSEEASDLWRRVLVAATAPPVASPGPHCSSCWERGRCGPRLLPAMAGPVAPELEPFIVDGGELTAEGAAKALLVLSAMRDIADRAEEQIRAAVKAGLRVELDGKVYAPSLVRGRVTADAAALQRDGRTEYLRQGGAYERWGWRRA